MNGEKVCLQYDLGPRPVMDLAEAWEIHRDTPTKIGREEIARSVLTLYDQSPDPTSAICDSLEDQLTDDEVAALASPRYLAPSTQSADDPYEQLWSTLKNFSTASEYSEVIKETADGILLSGSTAWGAFYASRGYGDKPSDVDLLCRLPDASAVRETVRNLYAGGLVVADELKRADKFIDLQESQTADIFSLRSFATGAETSMHFVTDDTMQKIVDFDTIPTDKLLTIRDFRLNPSSNVKRDGHYLINILDHEENAFFMPDCEVLAGDEKELGYLADVPVHCLLSDGTEKSYAMGIISFFLSIVPAIIYDKQGDLADSIVDLQDKIADVQARRRVVNVPRIERMPAHTIRQINNSLTSTVNLKELNEAEENIA